MTLSSTCSLACAVLALSTLAGCKRVEEPPEEGRFVLVAVNVLTPDGQRFLDNQTLVIDAGVIESIQPTSAAEPRGIFSGSYLIPGLVDFHHHLGRGDLEAHSDADRAAILDRLPAWGVTGAFDPNLSLERWEDVSPGVTDGAARFFRTGPSIGAPGGWRGVAVEGPEEARDAVRRAAASGVNAIKVVVDDMTWLGSEPLPVLADSALMAVVDEARRHDLPVWAHAPRLEQAKRALRLGVSGLLHGIVDEVVDQEFLDLIVQRGGPYAATFTVSEVYADFAHGVRRQRAMDPEGEFASIYRNLESDEMLEQWRSWWDRTDLLYRQLPVLRQNLLRVQEAGGLVVVGTDAATPGVVTGSSMHLEMLLHEEAGLRRHEILRDATYNAARAFGEEDQWGSVRVGLAADLLILERNPLEDLGALRSLQAVVLRGRVLPVDPLGRFAAHPSTPSEGSFLCPSCPDA